MKKILASLSICFFLITLSSYSQSNATIKFIKVHKKDRQDYETIVKEYIKPIFLENVKKGNIRFWNVRKVVPIDFGGTIESQNWFHYVMIVSYKTEKEGNWLWPDVWDNWVNHLDGVTDKVHQLIMKDFNSKEEVVLVTKLNYLTGFNRKDLEFGKDLVLFNFLKDNSGFGGETRAMFKDYLVKQIKEKSDIMGMQVWNRTDYKRQSSWDWNIINLEKFNNMDGYKNSNIFHNLSQKEYKYMIDNYGENLTTKQDVILTKTIATTAGS
tara:strand:+ start:161 stop:964 length:804 start_codon:yes stop_codon:yes gene_type:complete